MRKISVQISTTTILLVLLVQCYIYGQIYDECPEENEECVYHFVVNEKITMNYDREPVYAKDGVLYSGKDDRELPEDDVITMDGVKRIVVAVNNSIPGPPIIVYEGQKIIVHVTNHMFSESVTIHWHGMHQTGTPYSDGVAFITQCPINPGQHFTYEFKTDHYGTFFYHSHIGGQRVDGLFGALIVKKPTMEQKLPEAPTDVIMHVGDWLHVRSSQAYIMSKYGEILYHPAFEQPIAFDGMPFQSLMWTSGYIEGRGRYKDLETGAWTEPPYQIYTLEENERYRFRVIDSGILFPLRVSVDNHLITMVASDGYDFEQIAVESFIINPGERYDFTLEANQTVGNYWIRVQSMESNFNHYVRGIVRYNGANETKPTSSRVNCTSQNPCKVLNCPFLYFPEEFHTQCIQVAHMKATDLGKKVPPFEDDSIEHFLNWGNIHGNMAINGNVFEHPTVSALSQSDDIENDLKCNTPCENDKICHCYYELDIPYNKTVQLIWTNHGVGGKLGHPIHMHGHSFHVVKMGYADYNETTGLYIKPNSNIDCMDTSEDYCNRGAWANDSWGGDNIPGINLVNPPQKDTLMLPTGAYAIVRFRSDNPGKWFFHCHIEYHSMQGMAMVINEAPELIQPPPPGYPTCNNFYHNEELNEAYMKQENDEKKESYMGLFIMLFVILLLENFILIVCCCHRWRKKHKLPFGDMKSPTSYDSVNFTRM